MAHGHPDHAHHHHEQPGDFDWEAMADALELDAAITMPIVHQLWDGLDATTVHHVLDLGCGPGVVSCAIAERAAHTRVTALDSSAALLARARVHAAEYHVADRVDTLEADMELPLPTLSDIDLVWASMVLHHVADPTTVLARLRDVLQPGGSLVMVEFGNVPTVLPPGDPLLTRGTWTRFQQATTASLNSRLGLDPVTVDWTALLTAAGFVDITDRGLTANHPAPLTDTARAWLVKHVRRGVDMAADQLSPDDVAALLRLADDVPSRDDLFVRAERRTLIAHRP